MRIVAKQGIRADVWLNGVYQNWCAMADDTAGVVEVYERNEDGTFKLDYARGRFVTYEACGHVEIAMRPL